MEEGELFAVRKAKFDELCQKGQNPFRANCRQMHTNKQVLSLFEAAEAEGKTCDVAVAGRIIAFRLMGKASFLKLLDQTGTLPIYVSNNQEKLFNLTKPPYFDSSNLTSTQLIPNAA